MKHERSIHHYYSSCSISDLVAIPDFLTGAMENWGLIGFTSSYLLFDPEKTSDSLKQDVCETVTHELAHQVSQGTGSPSSQYEELLCVFFFTFMPTFSET